MFLTMGLQIKSIVMAVERDHGGVGLAVLIAGGALLLTVIVRAAYIAPLLAVLSARSNRSEKLRDRLTEMQEQMTTPEGKQQAFAEVNQGRPARGVGQGRRSPKATKPAKPPRPRSERDVERFAKRVTQSLADLEYFRRAPLGWREGTAVVWAGMRGAVTVAAAQTLPDDAPQRSVLVLIAFSVAVLSLAHPGRHDRSAAAPDRAQGRPGGARRADGDRAHPAHAAHAGLRRRASRSRRRSRASPTPERFWVEKDYRHGGHRCPAEGPARRPRQRNVRRRRARERTRATSMPRRSPSSAAARSPARPSPRPPQTR